jgi:hypothetical protein
MLLCIDVTAAAADTLWKQQHPCTLRSHSTRVPAACACVYVTCSCSAIISAAAVDSKPSLLLCLFVQCVLAALPLRQRTVPGLQAVPTLQQAALAQSPATQVRAQ